MEEKTMIVTESIEKDNAFFKEMLDYIPVNFYFSKETKNILRTEEDEESDIEEETNRKYGTQSRKRSQDVNPEEKHKKKAARFDPSLPQTVTQIQEHLLLSKEKATEGKLPHKKKKKKENLQTADDSSIRSSTDSLEDLRERLQARIDSLKEKRKALGKNDALEKKKMKRRKHVLERKMKRKLNKHNQAKGQAKDKLENGVKDTHLTSPSKPIFNKEGKLVFSKFDFSDSGRDKKKTDLPTGKDYKKLLENVTKQKEKIEHLKEIGQKDKAKELEKKNAWKTAIAKAEGLKVKNNPEMLKKALKRKENIKKKSRKEWEERSEVTESKLKKKQDKRSKNLQKRKKVKMEKKMTKMKKKGHIIPGF